MSLALHDLTVRFGTGRSVLTAVDAIRLEVPEGGTVGLVGESGCGKSTVARAIVDLVPLAGGIVTLDGDDYTARARRNTRGFRRRVQLILQDPYASLNPRMSVGAMLAEAVRQGSRQSGAQVASEVRRLLELVSLPASALDRYPHEFSGGQRQRIAIARALGVRPKIIISDEITSSLDVSVQATILTLLRDLQAELGVSYLFISHDLAAVRYMSKTIAVMYLGRIVETAATADLFSDPRHPYTRALIDSVPRVGSQRQRAVLSGELPDPRNPPDGCRFHTRCPIGPLYRSGREVCRTEDPQASAMERPHRAACHFAESASEAAGPPG